MKNTYLPLFGRYISPTIWEKANLIQKKHGDLARFQPWRARSSLT